MPEHSTLADARRVGALDRYGMLAFPPPCRAWIALSNDPDQTSLEGWKQVHELIWNELRLPFADSFFLDNRNEQWRDQVNLADHPEILAAHSHDTLHTWGDFTLSRGPRFHRDDAVAGLARLQAVGLEPRVWTDHADFTGNIFHRVTGEVVAERSDASGHRFKNPDYSLDLIHAAGVRYLWDGELTPIIGQDRVISASEWYAEQCGEPAKGRLLAATHALLAPLWRSVRAQLFSYRSTLNRQYEPVTLADGLRFYRFRRHGTWQLADIDGLGELLAPPRVDRLVQVQGTAIVYTHLGKRRAGRPPETAHVSPPTAAALRALASQHTRGEIELSSTSRLLDYLVLRDHARVTPGQVEFVADGIRFSSLGPTDLAGFQFGVFGLAPGFRVACAGSELPCGIEPLGSSMHRITT